MTEGQINLTSVIRLNYFTNIFTNALSFFSEKLHECRPNNQKKNQLFYNQISSRHLGKTLMCSGLEHPLTIKGDVNITESTRGRHLSLYDSLLSLITTAWYFYFGSL